MKILRKSVLTVCPTYFERRGWSDSSGRTAEIPPNKSTVYPEHGLSGQWWWKWEKRSSCCISGWLWKASKNLLAENTRPRGSKARLFRGFYYLEKKGTPKSIFWTRVEGPNARSPIQRWPKAKGRRFLVITVRMIVWFVAVHQCKLLWRVGLLVLSIVLPSSASSVSIAIQFSNLILAKFNLPAILHQ